MCCTFCLRSAERYGMEYRHNQDKGAAGQGLRRSVINCLAKKKEALRLCVSLPGPVLVFCGSAFGAEDMAREAAALLGNGRVRFFHEGLTAEERRAAEDFFFSSDDGILCADRAPSGWEGREAVRSVIHLAPPPGMEQYRAESGLAGSGGGPAAAVMLWSPWDDRDFSVCWAERLGCPPASFARDGMLALGFIRRHRRLYTRDALSFELVRLFNRADRQLFSIDVWEHADVERVLDGLEELGLIRSLPFLWQGRITDCKCP